MSIEEIDLDPVRSIEQSGCGCRRTVFASGREDFRPCVACALRHAGQALIAASDRMREERRALGEE